MKLLVVLSIVSLVVSKPTSSVTVPLTKIHRTGAYLKGAPDADRTRAAFLQSRAASGPITVPATNLAYGQYTTSVGIGNPPTYYNLLVDTGSSNTFCGTGTPYIRTSTSIPTGEAVGVTYGTGFFLGLEYFDQVTLASNLVLTNQSIGDALLDSDFGGIDGILGVGPVDLTQGTLLTDAEATIPTVMNNLVSQGLLGNQVLGVHFAPPVSYSDANGALTYGGTDSSLYKGELTYVLVTDTYPASQYWGINVTSVTYGLDTMIVPTSTAGVVDTGTTLVLLADDFFKAYMRAIPGAVLDSNTGLIEIPQPTIWSMDYLNFSISGREFTMDVAAQLIPTEQNAAWGGDPAKHYGVVGPLTSSSGEGLDFIIGQKFMERYYAVFDADAKRVGFAETTNTFTVYKY